MTLNKPETHLLTSKTKRSARRQLNRMPIHHAELRACLDEIRDRIEALRLHTNPDMAARCQEMNRLTGILLQLLEEWSEIDFELEDNRRQRAIRLKLADDAEWTAPEDSDHQVGL